MTLMRDYPQPKSKVSVKLTSNLIVIREFVENVPLPSQKDLPVHGGLLLRFYGSQQDKNKFCIFRNALIGMSK